MSNVSHRFKKGYITKGVYLPANSTRAVVCADIISFLAEPFRC